MTTVLALQRGALNAADPAGPQAARIDALTTFFLVVLGTVFVVVIGGMLYAAWRGHRRTEAAAGEPVERRLRTWVAGAVAVTVMILGTILVYNLGTGRALAAFADPSALTIRVTGHQWWWEVEYRDPIANRRLTTANEIHIPVGRRVRVEVESSDVIHSFWVPSLHGKIDLTPGYSAVTYLRADREGVYRGRCAEFCGLQHAHMDLLVHAVPDSQFARWYEAQLKPAPLPTDSLLLAGRDVFLGRSCAMCHAIRGTPANSRFGPDLTHVGSRSTLAAATIPNTRGHMAGWIMDPQRIKPGVHMPPNPLSGTELNALLQYLRSLQ